MTGIETNSHVCRGITALMPEEGWSAIDALKADEKEQVRRSRQNELMAAIYRLEESHEENLARLYSSLDRIRDSGPQDAIESAIIQQIEIVKSFSLRSAAKASLHFENQMVSERYLAQMERLNNQMLKFIAALSKRRGGSQQKVVVEHVSVSDGGRAVVGSVTTNGRK